MILKEFLITYSTGICIAVSSVCLSLLPLFGDGSTSYSKVVGEGGSDKTSPKQTGSIPKESIKNPSDESNKDAKGKLEDFESNENKSKSVDGEKIDDKDQKNNSSGGETTQDDNGNSNNNPKLGDQSEDSSDLDKNNASGGKKASDKESTGPKPAGVDNSEDQDHKKPSVSGASGEGENPKKEEGDSATADTSGTGGQSDKKQESETDGSNGFDSNNLNPNKDPKQDLSQGGKDAGSSQGTGSKRVDGSKDAQSLNPGDNSNPGAKKPELDDSKEKGNSGSVDASGQDGKPDQKPTQEENGADGSKGTQPLNPEDNSNSDSKKPATETNGVDGSGQNKEKDPIGGVGGKDKNEGSDPSLKDPEKDLSKDGKSSKPSGEQGNEGVGGSGNVPSSGTKDSNKSNDAPAKTKDDDFNPPKPEKVVLPKDYEKVVQYSVWTIVKPLGAKSDADNYKLYRIIRELEDFSLGPNIDLDELAKIPIEEIKIKLFEKPVWQDKSLIKDKYVELPKDQVKSLFENLDHAKVKQLIFSLTKKFIWLKLDNNFYSCAGKFFTPTKASEARDIRIKYFRDYKSLRDYVAWKVKNCKDGEVCVAKKEELTFIEQDTVNFYKNPKGS